MAGRLWVDVEDLFDYARGHARPTGIQRLAFEICHALYVQDSDAGQVQFVRHSPLKNSLRIVSWTEVAALFTELTEDKRPVGSVQVASQRGPVRQAMSRLSHRLPKSLRPALIDIFLTNQEATRSWARLMALIMRSAQQTIFPPPPPYNFEAMGKRPIDAAPEAEFLSSDSAGPASCKQEFTAEVAPNDTVLALGATWTHHGYAALIRNLREKHGVRFAMLIYDLIPLRRPEWFEHKLVVRFREWFDSLMPLSDHVFAISKATADDVESFAAERGIRLRHDVVAMPVGTGVTAITANLMADSAHAPLSIPPVRRALPAAGTYALLVSTIEARKNHLLMFRVWRQMLDEMPHEQVPTLVFAGRIGWLVEDLMHQIGNTGHLGGKLVIVEGPSDADLATLYGGCLFTLFPSFYEGWGLPVTESLALGKPCLISNRSSLPEAGGTLARYFDPDNLHDAYKVIRGIIEDPAGLARWEARVRREFEPVPWSASAESLLAGLAVEARALATPA